MDKRYRRSGSSFLPGIITFLLVTALAVGAGYLCTKYIIYPYILGEEMPFGKVDKEQTPKDGVEDQSKEQEPKSDGETPAVIEDGQDITDADAEGKTTETTAPTPSEGHTDAVSLYTIQYGSFATEEGAKEAASSLLSAGVGTIILGKDGRYKVVEEPYANEERARAVLPGRKASFGEAVFLTKMEAWMQ